MSGEDVLRELCRLTERAPADPGLMAAASAATIAANLLERDGDVTPARVVGRLRELGAAGLASRGPAARRLKNGRLRSYSRDLWSPTLRGREVDETLDRIRPARGGRFEPHASAGITIRESLALRRVAYRDRSAA